MTPEPPAFALEGISKHFGAVAALRDVSLRVDAGQVHALLGENGAGKTTLMHVAFGLVSPDAGSVRVRGKHIAIASPADAIAAGIGMVHQHFTLVPAMTVAENLVLGRHGVLRSQAMSTAVREIADATGFALEPDALVETLAVGAQQRVEIAKALAREARTLILDEPTAVLAPAETEDLLRWIRGFADAGNAVVLITHKLGEALAVADEVTVLRRGRVVFAGAAADTSPHELTVAMIGEEAGKADAASHMNDPENHPRPQGEPVRDVVLAARSITVGDEQGRVRLRDASLVVHAGEIVGVAGIEGAGQRELLRALAGRAAVASGTVHRPPHVGFVPEDRHRDAVLLDRSLTDNIALRGAGARRGRMPWHALRAGTQSLMREFDVRAPSAESAMRTLSGGNQQKLVLAREMAEPGSANLANPSAGTRQPALIVENPTRGLDVRATAEVQARLCAARDRGMAIVLYSSDLDEVLALATRVIVVRDGMLSEVPRDRDAVGRAMLGTA
jgi:general nucleoside transport system ATP-binding protein